MNLSIVGCRLAAAVAVISVCTACTMPTLVEIARRRQATAEDRDAGRNLKDDVRIKYSVTDWDVLNFTDEVKRKLADEATFHSNLRYGSATTQATLGGLAAAASVAGWGVKAASGFGLGATYVFGLGQIFDAKGHAQAYEQSFTSIQAAEATYYFHQLGMGFAPSTRTGKPVLLPADKNGRSDIPSQTNLTPDGETLYYRVSKILKVLDDTLANKIPDLQDLKDAKGDTSATPVAPAVPPDQKTINSGPAHPPKPPPAEVQASATVQAHATPGPVAASSPTPGPAPRSEDADVLRDFWAPNGVVNADHAKILSQWLDAHENGMHIATFIDATDPKYAVERAKARQALLTNKMYPYPANP
jgi:hypothetical protein